MNTTKHLKPEEIQLLLHGDSSSEQTDKIAQHVESCSECQKKLDVMAAPPELWKKASELITDTCLSETIALEHGDQAIRFARHQPEQGSPAGQDQEDLAWDYPVKDLMDEPSHPEMMGRIGPYEIESEVGRGGMGVVFKAFDSELNRPIAIKVLAPHLAASGAARKRFAREARAAAAVLHPNVIAIHGVANTDKTPYIAMPYVAGPSLQKLVDQNGPLELKELVRITMQIAAGLAAAHSQAVIHRDIKPANILIERDVSRVVITDFGLARAENDASMTRTGWLAGTPNFMSPEQALGKRVDGRSDLFSLGSVMYFMATGRLPFRADAPMAILNRICNDQPTPVRQVNADVSKTLAEIIEKLLQKDPEDRFASAGDLHQTLEQYLAYLHQPDVSRPPVINERAAKLKSAWIGVAMAGALCLAIFGFNQGWFSQPNDSPVSNGKQFPLDAKGSSSLVDNDTEVDSATADKTNAGSNQATAHSNDPETKTSKLSIAELEQQLEALTQKHGLKDESTIQTDLWNLKHRLQSLDSQLQLLPK